MSQMDDKKSVDVMRRKTQLSATKNRRTVERPTKTYITQRKAERIPPTMFKKQEIKIMPVTQESIHIQAIKNSSAGTESLEAPQPYQQKLQQNLIRQQSRQAQQGATKEKVSSAQMKDEAIQKAMRAASNDSQKTKSRRHFIGEKYIVHFGFKRFALALACAAAAVFAIVYFVNLNKPDIALRVAAIQNGIEASYPKYTPRGFNLTDITSENGRITLNFNDEAAENSYTIVEEKSSWDSNALLANYAKPNYEDNYTVIKEQGLTLYVSNNEACWVNGGILYKLKITSGSLTKKQIKTIATSL